MYSYRIFKNSTHVKVKLTSLSSPAKEVGRNGTCDPWHAVREYHGRELAEKLIAL